MATVLPAIFLLGIFTRSRLVDAVIEYIHFPSGIARICGCFRPLAPEAASFFSAESGQWLAR